MSGVGGAIAEVLVEGTRERRGGMVKSRLKFQWLGIAGVHATTRVLE